MLKADKIIKDAQTLKKMYGDNLEIEVDDDYYRCYFKNSLGKFKFLVSEDRLHRPFSLSYEDEQISKAIETLQEL